MHAFEDGKMHSLILLLIALLTFESFAEADTEMQAAEESSEQDMAASRPLRLLEDEPDHLHRNLVLTDFEVKGTLGTSFSDRLSSREQT